MYSNVVFFSVFLKGQPGPTGPRGTSGPQGPRGESGRAGFPGGQGIQVCRVSHVLMKYTEVPPCVTFVDVLTLMHVTHVIFMLLIPGTTRHGWPSRKQRASSKSSSLIQQDQVLVCSDVLRF